MRIPGMAALRTAPSTSLVPGILGVLAVAGALGACAPTALDPVVDIFADPFTGPHKFRFLRCEDIAQRMVAANARAQELRDLMARASTGPGGSLINLVAYQPDYTMVLSDLKQLHETAAEKECPPPVAAPVPVPPPVPPPVSARPVARPPDAPREPGGDDPQDPANNPDGWPR